MKKWISLALAFLMLLTASCGGASGSQDTTAASGNDTTAAPVTTELTDGLEDKNMEGFSFNILHHDDTWLTWAKTQLVADEENGDLINDTIYKRNSYIEDRFNAKINVTGVSKVADVFKQEVLSGDNNYDIIFQYGINVLGNVDLLADMNNIPISTSAQTTGSPPHPASSPSARSRSRSPEAGRCPTHPVHTVSPSTRSCMTASRSRTTSTTSSATASGPPTSSSRSPQRALLT